jgi:hypothetical protein
MSTLAKICKDSAVIKPQLVGIGSVEGAEYNPRAVIPERLDALILSLKYLGFLSPIYVNQNGVILSGHQRIKAAAILGYTKVPVVVVQTDDADEHGLNLYFNRITCDMTKEQMPESVFEDYKTKEVDFSLLQSIAPDTYYPCMEGKMIEVSPYIDTLPLVTANVRDSATIMFTKGIYIPLIINEETGALVNGIARLYSLVRKGYARAMAVTVPDNKAVYADLALNFLSMDFDLSAHFEDKLRYNAFRRASVSVQIIGLSRTYTYFVFNRALRSALGGALDTDGSQARNTDLDLLPHINKESFEKFKATYGMNIVDFGAGTYHDAELMEEAGFNMIPFEPYSLDADNKPCLAITRVRTLAFFSKLKALNRGQYVDTVLSSYVLNSIPFHKDRMAYLCIAAALCGYKTNFYICTQYITKRSRGSASEYSNPNLEANMSIGKGIKDFKVQKFFYSDELKRMLQVFWVEVEMRSDNSTSMYAICRKPKRINKSLLVEALSIEFNLPHKTGSIDLIQEAITTFSVYLNTTLDMTMLKSVITK